MYWLIETDDQLEMLLNSGFEDAFIEIIPYHNKIHPVENNVCALYLRPLNSTKGFIVSLLHSEALSINIDKVNALLNNFKAIYVRDKKEFLHYFVLKGLYDITLTQPTYIQEYTQTHTYFYNKYPTKTDINCIIPIVKHYEYCEKIFNDLKDRIKQPINEFYNNKATVVFNAIEQSGLLIDKPMFSEHFYEYPFDYVYTQYNFKTLTTRPSNKFGGINYAALNKENGDRGCFVPRNDYLFEIDISAYHPSLLGKLVKYDFGENSIYDYFTEMLGIDRDQAKKLVMSQLYGGVRSEWEYIEFFKKVKAYTDDLWDTFQYGGFIECPISKHIYKKDDLEDMNPNKLLNYVLQNLETSLNIIILWEIFKLLKNKQTKLVLYTYDSFLFDLDKSEKETMQSIMDIFEKHKLKIKISYGKTYDFQEGH